VHSAWVSLSLHFATASSNQGGFSGLNSKVEMVVFAGGVGITRMIHELQNHEYMGFESMCH